MEAANVKRVSPAQFNAALEHPSVKAAVRFFALRRIDFRSGNFVESLSRVAAFPSVQVKHIILAAKAAGVSLKAVHAGLEEMRAWNVPFMTFLKRTTLRDSSVDLFAFEKIDRTKAVMRHDRFGKDSLAISEVGQRWTGVCLVVDGDVNDRSDSGDIFRYRGTVSVLEQFLSADQCRELISYCEKACFERSRVMRRAGGGVTDVLSTKVRSSSSVILKDRSHPLLKTIYERCAFQEGVPEGLIEQIQCVRYRRGQRFKAHFDAGIDLPRMTTYLLYLNDDFEGGETFFPLLDIAVAPKTGSCLRFASSDREGRILWPSEHGGLPVSSGVKYALNIWVRCPPTPTSINMPTEPMLSSADMS